MRKKTSSQMLVESAQAAVPTAYNATVANNAFLRPMRSPNHPNSTPPAAQPTSRIEVIAPVQNTVADRAAGEPGGR